MQFYDPSIQNLELKTFGHRSPGIIVGPDIIKLPVKIVTISSGKKFRHIPIPGFIYSFSKN